VEAVITALGKGFTVTTAVAEPVQPDVVPETVYVVVVPGDTEMGLVISPELQE
jgi:hypothetical protein